MTLSTWCHSIRRALVVTGLTSSCKCTSRWPITPTRNFFLEVAFIGREMTVLSPVTRGNVVGFEERGEAGGMRSLKLNRLKHSSLHQLFHTPAPHGTLSEVNRSPKQQTFPQYPLPTTETGHPVCYITQCTPCGMTVSREYSKKCAQRATKIQKYICIHDCIWITF